MSKSFVILPFVKVIVRIYLKPKGLQWIIACLLGLLVLGVWG